jgi:hypothetical protein
MRNQASGPACPIHSLAVHSDEKSGGCSATQFTDRRFTAAPINRVAAQPPRRFSYFKPSRREGGGGPAALWRVAHLMEIHLTFPTFG